MIRLIILGIAAIAVYGLVLFLISGGPPAAFSAPAP